MTEAAETFDFVFELQRVQMAMRKSKPFPAELFPLGELLAKNKIPMIQILTWLGGCTVTIRWEESAKIAQIIPPGDEAALLEHRINWFRTNAVGPLALKAFGAIRVYVHRSGGNGWSYPPEPRRKISVAPEEIPWP